MDADTGRQELTKKGAEAEVAKEGGTGKIFVSKVVPVNSREDSTLKIPATAFCESTKPANRPVTNNLGI